MARETHELWSWDERNGHWLAIAQGTERAMKDGAQSRYGSSRKFKMWGSAFTVTRRGDGPHDTPAALGVEVVTAPAEPADSQTPPGRRLVIADDTKDDVVAMLAEAESEIEWYENCGLALAAERDAIKSESPLLNLNGRKTGMRMFMDQWRELELPGGEVVTMLRTQTCPRWLIGDDAILEHMERVEREHARCIERRLSCCNRCPVNTRAA